MERDYIDAIDRLKEEIKVATSWKRKRDLNKCMYRMQKALNYYRLQRGLVDGKENWQT
jgi:hypothetical protein